MKNRMSLAIIPCCAVLLVIFGCAVGKNKAGVPTVPADAKHAVSAADAAVGGGSLEEILFKTFNGKERVMFRLTNATGFEVARESDHSIVVKIADASVPESLRGTQGAGTLRNVRSVRPVQKIVAGTHWVYIYIELGHMVPYRVREDLGGYILDFDVSALPARIAKVTQGTRRTSRLKTIELLEQETQKDDVSAEKTAEIKKYSGEKIALLSFQKADIKSVLRSISEFSGVNIVAGPDVKGSITIHMKDVPWDQALDTILEINGYGKKQTGSVITILPLDQLKKAEEEQLKKDVAQGKLRQISIEAKIVEVNTTVASELGIRWGGGYLGSWNGTDIGTLFSNSGPGKGTSTVNLPYDPGTYAAVTNANTGIGVTDSHLAVNFPSAFAATTPALGILIGTSSMVLDAQLGALEATGKGKVISSPRVVTLDNVKATIKQGQEIPYVTTDKEGNRTVEMKDAALSLEVKPRITDAGKISMQVKANNDVADFSKTNTSNENPPINTSSVDSTIVVRDGDTIVVGGIYKMTETESLEEVPFLSDIPVLGWLFRYKAVSSEKREILIFVTPRIVPEDEEA